MQFKSKLKLDMKQSLKDLPEVRAILADYLQKLQVISEERDREMEEFMEEHAETKFKQNQEIKKRYNMKLALA